MISFRKQDCKKSQRQARKEGSQFVRVIWKTICLLFILTQLRPFNRQSTSKWGNEQKAQKRRGPPLAGITASAAPCHRETGKKVLKCCWSTSPWWECRHQWYHFSNHWTLVGLNTWDLSNEIKVTNTVLRVLTRSYLNSYSFLRSSCKDEYWLLPQTFP